MRRPLIFAGLTRKQRQAIRNNARRWRVVSVTVQGGQETVTAIVAYRRTLWGARRAQTDWTVYQEYSDSWQPPMTELPTIRYDVVDTHATIHRHAHQEVKAR